MSGQKMNKFNHLKNTNDLKTRIIDMAKRTWVIHPLGPQ